MEDKRRNKTDFLSQFQESSKTCSTYPLKAKKGEYDILTRGKSTLRKVKKEKMLVGSASVWLVTNSFTAAVKLKE